jgi:hypothetical protein
VKKFIRLGFEKRLCEVFTPELWRIYRAAVMLSPSFRAAEYLRDFGAEVSMSDDLLRTLENRVLYVDALRAELLADWNACLEQRVDQWRVDSLKRQAEAAQRALGEAEKMRPADEVHVSIGCLLFRLLFGFLFLGSSVRVCSVRMRMCEMVLSPFVFVLCDAAIF